MTSWLGVGVTLLATIATLLLASFLWYEKRFRYWAQRGVTSIPASFPFGNLGGVGVSRCINEATRAAYDGGQGLPYVGFMFMFRPGLILRDVHLIRQILVKDFSHFHDHGLYFCEETDPLSGHLFNQNGLAWKQLRAQMTPTFTSGKIKMMFPIVSQCGRGLCDALAKSLGGAEEVEVEMKDLMARYSTDVIMACAFGVQTNTLRHEDEEYRKMGAKVFEPSLELAWRNVVSYIMPGIAELIKLRVTSKEVTKFFMGCFRDTVKYRKDSGLQKKDFLQLLIELMEKGRITDQGINEGQMKKLTESEAAAQAFVFFIAGFETTSTTLQYALYELSRQQSIQTQVAEEIQLVLNKYGGEVTYEGLKEMKLLDCVMSETLRMYPPITLLRVCTKQYTMPDTGLVVEEGTPLLVPLLGLHRDPLLFEDPDTFRPARFAEDEVATRDAFTYLPFGEGPRHCIGARFAQIVTKIGLVSVLSHFRVNVSQKTLIPLEFDPQCSILSPKGGMYLNLTSKKEKYSK